MASKLWILGFILFFLNLLHIWYARGLNRFNGPFLASFTDLWKVWYAFNRSQEQIYVDIHRKYGDIVRIGPNTLSFADPHAIHDIYGPKGSPQKSEMYHTTSMPRQGVLVNNLLAATDEKWHDRERRLINSAFSLTQIIRYEPWVDGTIALFWEKLRTRFAGKGASDGVVNFMEWLGYFSADVISEMTFSERAGFWKLEQMWKTSSAVFDWCLHLLSNADPGQDNIQESMCLHVVTRMPHDRVVLPPGLVVCGQHIAAGTDVGVYGSVLHHRAAIFGEDVGTFRPERWLADEEKVRKMKNTLFTFSSGKYNCLGQNIARMEVAKLVPSVIRMFELSLVNPEKDWTLIPGAFAIPADFYVRVREIRSS